MPSGPLIIEAFGVGDALDRIGISRQVGYLRCYFADLNAKSIVEEPSYFDRDYLAEFAAFYSTTVRQHGNRCRRVHFFSDTVTRQLLSAAAGGSRRSIKRLQSSYLGFAVVRPLAATPLGRVVAKWYPDASASTTPRVIEPARDYLCHLAGVPLRVRGLGWQQQDTAVGACATIALWSMLHSSAFDDAHAIPTTADITRFAHRTASLGSRVFPSNGLHLAQVLEAIKEAGLAPVVLDCDKQVGGRPVGFSAERFTSTCASLIRSGYPVLLLGNLENVGGHAICAVGFRECAASAAAPGSVALQDAGVQRLYIHDDNIGPNARFEIKPHTNNKLPVVQLERCPPKNTGSSWLDPSYPMSRFTPTAVVAALDESIRISPDTLHGAALRAGKAVADLLASNEIPVGVTVSTRLMRLVRYHEELGRLLASSKRVLGRTRLALWEDVPSMSLHVGLVRIGVGASPLIDILFDTSDSSRNTHAFCHVLFHPSAKACSDALGESISWGQQVAAF